MLLSLLPAVLTAVVAVGHVVPSAPVPRVGDAPFPVRFTENRGQEDARVRFTARQGDLHAWVLRDELVLRLDAGDDDARTVALRFEGAADACRVEGAVRAAGVARYYRGDDPARWVDDAPLWESVRWRGVHEGVDVRLVERGGRLAYDLLLAPGASLDDVVVACEGAERLELAAPDRLVVQTAAGPLEQSLPAAWEVDDAGGRVPVRARFRLLGDARFGFEVDVRDASRPLVVDPGLGYGTYLGGTLLDEATAVGLAPDGDLVVAGSTGSPNFPVASAHQGNRAGNNDAFIARLDAATGALVYATYFGGADTTTFEPEGARDLAVGVDGSVTVVGRAASTDFPRSPGTVGAADPGGADGFVARFDASGALVWSTLVGGNADDVVNAVAVDATGVCTLAGTTTSNDFPATTGAYDETFNSIFFTNDLFVARLAADASAYAWATYVGGSLREEAFGVAVAADGSAVVTGITGSSDFPATAGAYDETFNGSIPNETDAFVLRVSADGSTLAWATFLGSLFETSGRTVALDADGDVVVAGWTAGDDFPTTAGAFQEGFGGGATDAFVSKLSADGASLLWSTFLGGDGDDAADDLALTTGGQPTVTGATTSADFPVQSAAPVRTVDGGGKAGGPSRATSKGAAPTGGPGASPTAPAAGTFAPTYEPDNAGGEDAFLARLASSGTQLLYGTLHGGAGDDGGRGVALDGLGAAVVAGVTTSSDLPVPGALDASFNGASDTFLARWTLPPFEGVGLATAGPSGAAPTLRAEGSLEPGRPLRLLLSGAPAGARGALLVGRRATEGPVPGVDGALVVAVEHVLPLRTDAEGAWSLVVERWPAELPAGARLVVQAWVEDGEGVASSGGVALLAP